MNADEQLFLAWKEQRAKRILSNQTQFRRHNQRRELVERPVVADDDVLAISSLAARC